MNFQLLNHSIFCVLAINMEYFLTNFSTEIWINLEYFLTNFSTCFNLDCFFFFLWAFTLDMVGIHCFLDHMSSYVFIYSPFLMKYCLNKLLKLLRKKTFTWSGSYPTKILNTVYQILCSNSFHFLLKFYRILFTIS